MSRENVEMIRRMLETRDPRELRAVLHDDVVWDIGALRQIMGGAGRYHGAEGVLRFFREWVSAFTEWSYDIVDVSAVGDCVIAELHQWGIGRGSGARVGHHFWQVWTIQDSKAVRGTNHEARDEAIAAARSAGP